MVLQKSVKKANTKQGRSWHVSKKRAIALGGLSLLVALMGVAGVANASKPGDTLYSVDRALERLQLSLLSPTDGLKEAQYRRMADERLAELQALFAEKDLNTEDIAEGLGDFEDHKAALAKLISEDDSETAEDAAKDFIEKESSIDKLFAAHQKSLEDKRESLKRQLEEAIKNGDTALMASLAEQIAAIEPALKKLEQEREAAKQELEKHSEKIEEHVDESTKQQNEAAREAAKQQAEAQKKQIEIRNEQAKQAIEQAREAQEKAAEAAKKAAEKAAEAEKKRLEEEKESQE